MQNKTSAADKTDRADINDERAIRLAKLNWLREQGIEPYPSRGERRQTAAAARRLSTGKYVSIAGRLMTKREMGNITFCHLQDESGQIQIAFKKDEVGSENYKLFIKKIDIADIILVQGKRFRTHKGEESILVGKWKLLSKALRPLPDKFHGLQDEELRLRKRYLDLLMDPDLRELFRRKAKFWHSIRNFLLKEGFLEVETPVLETTTGGAEAAPFVSHHEALDLDIFLRISMGELWQKRLMVAGFEKTFEIGRQFRNEGISREHLQDYTQMEFYWAYADYEDGMKLVEKMYKQVIKTVFGTLKFNIHGFKNIDLGKKWKKIDYSATIKKMTGLDISRASVDEIRAKLAELKVVYQDHEQKGRLLDSLWKFCRKSIAGPVFLVNHPALVSPLAKRSRLNPDLTERYQIIIAGSELGNGYSELNDPIDQTERFALQARLRAAGDTEAQMPDHDFVEALEYGLPPTTGFGLSERVFAFFADKSIRECVLFPLVKPSRQ